MRETLPASSSVASVDEAIFRAIFEDSADAIVVVGADGKVLRANRAARDDAAIDVERFAERPEVAALRADVLANGRASYEVHAAGPSGGKILSIEGTRHEAVVIMTIRDRTASVASEGELRALRRAESVGLMTATVVHDFNNLLTPILGLSELLCRDVDASPRSAAMAAEIRAAAASAAGLVRRVLAFARCEPPRKKRTDVNAIVAEVRRLVDLVAGDRIEVGVTLTEDAGDVVVDRGDLECVVLNLVANARDAMPRGGRVAVRTAAVTLDDAGDGTGGPDGSSPVGEYVVLAVTDTGTGMTREARERLFERFFTTKGAHGTGLGLASVQRFAKEHGGHVVVRSEPGNGTTVALYLPRATVARDRDSAPICAEIPRGTETVLLVEDDTRVRAVVCEVLVDRGYQVVACASGEEAIACSDSRTFDLVLSDVVMPGMDGRELVDRLRASGRATRALFMSGHTDRAIEARGVPLDDGALLRKAFTPSQLARRVRETLDAPARASATSIVHACSAACDHGAVGEQDAS